MQPGPGGVALRGAFGDRPGCGLRNPWPDLPSDPDTGPEPRALAESDAEQGDADPVVSADTDADCHASTHTAPDRYRPRHRHVAPDADRDPATFADRDTAPDRDTAAYGDAEPRPDCCTDPAADAATDPASDRKGNGTADAHPDASTEHGRPPRIAVP